MSNAPNNKERTIYVNNKNTNDKGYGNLNGNSLDNVVSHPKEQENCSQPTTKSGDHITRRHKTDNADN